MTDEGLIRRMHGVGVPLPELAAWRACNEGNGKKDICEECDLKSIVDCDLAVVSALVEKLEETVIQLEGALDQRDWWKDRWDKACTD